MVKNIFLFLFAAVALCFAGLHNKFPLLTPNSGVFINAGFNHSLTPLTRSFYGLFVAHASWSMSIWLVIFSQSLMLTAVLYYCFRYFSGGRVNWPYFFLYVLFLIYTTAASVAVSTIDPAIFGAVTILASGLLLLVPDLSQRDQWILLLILVLCSLVSRTNLLYLSVVALLGLFVLFWKQKLNRTRYGCILTVVSCGWLLSITGQQVLPSAVNVPSEILYSSSKPPYLIGVNIIQENQNSASYKAISSWFNLEIREYLISRQFQGWLHYTYLNYAIICTAIAGFIGCLLLTGRCLVPILYLVSGILLQTVIAHMEYPGIYQVSGQSAWLLTLPAWCCLTAYMSGKPDSFPIALNAYEKAY